ncbi:MAG: FliA/WhiG family RNA polymerase sigma factor [Nitrospirae bacterium]|nr:FliA/WhiG family RNA polymerase sigma factor [Nitrospirota bacterium]
MQGYKTEISEEEKEQVIKDFLPFIKYTANRLSWRLPPQMTVDDLVSAGLMGLMDALGKFEHGRVKLKTYAEFRIKGSMLDELRAVDWVPRSLKKKIGTLKNAYGKLEKSLGRVPEDEEVADELNISLDEYYKTLQDANGSLAFRFEDFEANGSSDNGLNILECIPDPNAHSPLSILEDAADKEILAKMIGELPEKEKLLLSLYYWEELTMKEIGRIMKITEGRVCQLHNQALLRLRAKVEAQLPAKETSAQYR